MQALNSQNEKGTLTGLLTLFGLVKKYEFEMDKDREPLYEIWNQVIGILGNLVNQVMGSLEDETALQILHLIGKVFFASNQLQILPFLAEGDNLVPWMQFFKQILDLAVPAELSSITEDKDVIAERDQHMLWKIKAVIGRITYRMFSKYGRTEFVDAPQREFSAKLVATYSETLLDTHLGLLFKRKSEFVGTKTVSWAIKYVTYAMKVPITMEKLKPYIENILYEIVIPIMLITHKDSVLFEQDPTEYVRKQLDFTETLYMPKQIVIDLLNQICQYDSAREAAKEVKKRTGNKQM